jgi:hypothetical protein
MVSADGRRDGQPAGMVEGASITCTWRRRRPTVEGAKLARMLREHDGAGD